MKKICLLALFMLTSTSLMAHQAPIHKHAQLVPIPAYAQPYGEASAKSAHKAIDKFLDTFNATTRKQFMFSLTAKERKGWTNLPAGIVARSGISVGELSDNQRKLLFEFLSSSLGKEGYESVAEALAAEAFLSADARAKKLKWAPENYWFSIYGMPSADKPWGWQFGGHHLALNISIQDNKVTSLSPSFIGAEPAVFSINGQKYEAVRDMHLSGYAVFKSLGPQQKKRADAKKIPEDVVTGPDKDGVIPPVIGISASDMDAAQKALLLKAIAEWVTIQPDENAASRMQELEAGIDNISFAWRGNDEVNTPTYMRIQGPTLIIEMLSTGGNIGDSAQGAGHYHTIYRNPQFEYGQKR